MKKQIGFYFLLINLLAVGVGNCAQPDTTNGVVQVSPPSTNGFSNWRAAFSVGAEFLNPYVISVPSGAAFGTLSNAGNGTVGYLQFDIQRRWVFAPHPIYAIDTNSWVNRFPIFSIFSTDRSWDAYTPDFQYDIGFLFANNVSSTNKTYSAQTLAGSDIFAQIGAGLPLWRNDWNSDNGIPVQLSASGSVGMTTQQSFEKIHPNYFLGGTLDVGLNHVLFGIGSTNAPGLAEFKIGEACLDFPSMTGTANQVNLDGNQIPKFDEKWVPEMGANVLLPVGNYLYLNVEADAFLSRQTPNQWNIKVGATIPWSTIQSMFTFLK